MYKEKPKTFSLLNFETSYYSPFVLQSTEHISAERVIFQPGTQITYICSHACPDSKRLPAMGCRFRLLEAPHECIISLLALYECILCVPVSGLVLGGCRVVCLLSVIFLPLRRPESRPTAPLIWTLGSLLLSESRRICPKGDLQPSDSAL